MTKEEKDLLLRDLCARLPYGVKVQVADCKTPVELSHIDTKNGNGRKPYCFVFAFEPERVKPYLRPMSSMTKEELEELLNKEDVDFDGKSELVRRAMMAYSEGNQLKSNSLFSMQYAKAIDWLNAHHFDYRGLIPKGLALEAPEGLYNSKTE